jgi:erythromycin esterase-like protein
LYHADRCAEHVAAAGLTDFDLAYAHEARARALACLGRLDEAAAELAAAREVLIADDEDRTIVEGDLATGPWYGLGVTVAP